MSPFRLVLLLLLEVRHVDIGGRPAVQLESAQRRYVSSLVVLYKDGEALDPLVQYVP